MSAASHHQRLIQRGDSRPRPRPAPDRDREPGRGVHRPQRWRSLCLEVQPSGWKTFRLSCRFAGVQRTLRVGPYPETKLAEARFERKRVKADRRAGKGPAGDKRPARVKPKPAALAVDETRPWPRCPVPQFVGAVPSREGDGRSRGQVRHGSATIEPCSATESSKPGQGTPSEQQSERSQASLRCDPARARSARSSAPRSGAPPTAARHLQPGRCRTHRVRCPARRSLYRPRARSWIGKSRAIRGDGAAAFPQKATLAQFEAGSSR